MDIRETSTGLLALAPGKLNLFLEILGKRPDGYHELVSVMQTVSVFDELAFERTSEGISLSTNTPDAPADERNLVYKAAAILLEESGSRCGARISLTKRVAIGAGMGGGSSDAATTLVALNRLWELHLSQEHLHDLAARLGSDVPFFLYGGTCLCRGRGEIIEPLDEITPLTYVVVTPGLSVSTKEVYQKYRPDLTSGPEDYKLFLSKLRGAGSSDIPPFFNRLEAVTTQLEPQLKLVADRMRHAGLRGVTMTGSGSAFFAVAAGRKEANEAVAGLSQLGIGRVVMAETVGAA